MTIHIWVKEKGLPSHKIGRCRRYRLTEVDAWVKANEKARRPRPMVAAAAAHRRQDGAA